MFQTTDETLVKKALKGKADAWDQLITRYERKIFNFTLRMTGNREDAMDLMQEVFLAVYRNLASFRGESAFSSWLFGIASFRCADFFRKKKPVDSIEEESQLGPDLSPETNPFDQVARNQMNRKIVAMLARLPGEQRLVIELKFFQEKTFDEISELLGISSNTLKSRLYGALRKIRTMPEVAHAM